MSEKIDVALNVFAKPFQTALAILSLLEKSGAHIRQFWLQYEPVGVKYDRVDPYAVVRYLGETGVPCRLSQPERWLDLEAATPEMLRSAEGRSCIRYEHAFENSDSRLLFIMHNDIFVFKDVLGDLKRNLGEAFAIGQLGQCWNCPAANGELTRAILGREPCSSQTYREFRTTHEELCRLYAGARERGLFVRPYDTENFAGEFARQPWPLPECRVNEWACLLNLEKARPLAVPHGAAWPVGAYRPCGEVNLDIGTPFFRDLHALGLFAKHMDLSRHLKHWVGTGNNTPSRYAYSEDRARGLLQKHYPEYLAWLEENDGKTWH